MVLLEREMMKYKIRVETHNTIRSPLPWPMEIRFKQVLLNLLINAGKRCPAAANSRSS